MDKFEHRRLRLAELREARCNGRTATLARRIGRDASYVARMLYPEGKLGKKRIAEEMIDVIEEAFGLPHGWFDLPLGSLLGTDAHTDRGCPLIDPECVDLWERYKNASPQLKRLVDVALSREKRSEERRDQIKTMIDAALLVVNSSQAGSTEDAAR